jgi:hypothetical protein
MQAGVSPAKEDEEQKQKQKEDTPAAISSPGAPVDRKSPERGDSQRLVTRQGREQTEYEAKLRKMRQAKGLDSESHAAQTYVPPALHDPKTVKAAADAAGVTHRSRKARSHEERLRMRYEEKLHQARVARGLSAERSSGGRGSDERDGQSTSADRPAWLGKLLHPGAPQKRPPEQAASPVKLKIPDESLGQYSSNRMAYGLWALDLEEGADDDDFEQGFVVIPNQQQGANQETPAVSNPRFAETSTAGAGTIAKAEDRDEVNAEAEDENRDSTDNDDRGASDEDGQHSDESYDANEFGPTGLLGRSPFSVDGGRDPFGRIAAEEASEFGGRYVPGWQLGDGYSGGHV